MKNSLSDGLLSRLSEFFAGKMALHFPPERFRDLEHRAGSAAKEFGFADTKAFIEWLVSSSLTRDQMEILASHFTIAETYFWREPQVFEALQEHIVPELMRLREKGEKRLRIWSAGCATGEEPYSLAIALRRTIPALEKWHVTILATDINPRILRKAAAGVYGEWSFRNPPAWLKSEYFNRKDDGKFRILPQLREMVTFAYLNLAEDNFPSTWNNTNAMDLIFCRNVLMYFGTERARQVGQSLYCALVNGGWLMVGASELSHLIFPQFVPVHLHGAIVYRKTPAESRTPASFRFEEIPPQEVLLRPLAQADSGIEPPPFSNSVMAPQADSPSPLQQSVFTGASALCLHEHNTETVKAGENEALPSKAALSVRILANQGSLSEALALCEKAIAAVKLDPGLHYLRATILQEQNKEDEAIASLKRSLYLAPDFVMAHFVLGNLLLRKRNPQTAKKCFENALVLLNACGREDILPESDGLTTGRFREIVDATMRMTRDDF